MNAADDVSVSDYIQANCRDCHQGTDAEAGLDLSVLSAEISAENLSRWVTIYDRVAAGEMPPRDVPRPPEADTSAALSRLKQDLTKYQQTEYDTQGRVRGRRLTRVQLEHTLQDLLGIDVPLAAHMPDDPRTNGYASVASGQSISHFQMQTHLNVVDIALDEAFRRALHDQPDEWQREFTAREIARRNPRQRCREPEMREEKAVVCSSRLIFYGRLPATTAREDGWYRLTLNASALKSPKSGGVWCTVRTGPCTSSAPLLAWSGAFEATETPQTWSFDAWVPRGHMFEVRPGDDTLKMAKFGGGQVGTGEGEPQNVPGIAIHSATLQRIHQGPADDRIRQILFGDLKVVPGERNRPARVVSEKPARDARRLLLTFAQQAFRRPVTDEDIAPYAQMVRSSLADGVSLTEALRNGYRAILCSPRFLHFQEQPGPLDDYAIAARMSYLLWSSLPDDELMQLADAGKLQQPEVRRAQTERMLRDPRGGRFVRDFAAEWLDLKDIDFTEPDRRLYPGFDVIVQESMLTETHRFLQTMLDENLSVTNLIDADFTWLNSRLARYYGRDDVDGNEFRQVSLSPEDPQRGLLTQGAILKVTANGTTTSPVIRGIWVSERLLGVDIPAPPQGVPAIEPDIRGAKTIREMLARHKSDVSCASCHVKIDPPGFALEPFDPSGRHRRFYAVAARKRDTARLQIDASGELPDGRPFASTADFQKLITTQPRGLAENVTRHLLTYGTGAVCSFADRDAVTAAADSALADSAAAEQYGLKSLLLAVINSEIFLHK
ncbi:MAG: DUF1592 domain-containing protein [Planctomycetaceae bacterium]|nr:DUF1592 domain-containing protein [Planctomycetaceae bacterium]